MDTAKVAAAREGTILFLLERARGYLAGKGIESARLDAELLLAKVLGSDRLALYLRFDEALPSDKIDHYRELILRRAAGEPTAYLTGKREFWSLDFEVSEAVLVPRPETETVIETALELAGSRPPDLVLDLGTGAGNLAVALAREWPEARIVASDISLAALEIARRNVLKHGVAQRVSLVAGDRLCPFARRPIFSLLVTNPPYVPAAEQEQLPAEVRLEPWLALDGGEDGLCFFRALACEAPQVVKRGGWLVAEVGQGQACQVRNLWQQSGFVDIQVRADLAGVERVVAARLV